jgi:SAM-dependent methyltransferase
MDMEKLDFEDESFNLAYSSLAIHYVDDWTQPLKEAYRVLKDDGMYIFSCGHPIDDSLEHFKNEEVKGSLLGRTIKLDTEERKVYGDYLAIEGNGTKSVDGQLGTMDVRVFHRTFSKMLDQIQASGFKIKKLVEPQPTEGMKAINAGVYLQLTRIPAFMIWVLSKQ